ncbi:MAG: hypothetical protein AAGH15_01075 [Myxococcota bacterium]
MSDEERSADPPAVVPPVMPWGSEFAFGESPFRVKGVLYQGTQTYFEREHGGLDALLEVIDDAPLRAFIAQRFLSTKLYDVMPVPALIAYEAIATGMSLRAYLDARTRWQLERDVRGVYRMLLSLASPEAVVQRLPKVLVQMFAFPQVAVERPEPRVREASFLHVPAPLEPWLAVSFPIYIEHAMRLSGAKDVRVERLSPRPEGRSAGLRQLTLRLRVAWD